MTVAPRRLPVPVRTRIAGLGLLLLAAPGALMGLEALFRGFDMDIGTGGSTARLELAYGAVTWGVGESVASLSIWVFVLVIVPLSWVTLAALLIAWSGDLGWLIPVTVAWLAFGLVLAVASGTPATAYAAAGILVLLLSGRAVRRLRQARAERAGQPR